MDHGPAVQLGPDNAIRYKSKLGVILFFVYAFIYGLFVAINTFNPVIMETEIFFGLNLAIVYGFGLILFAIILGIIYNYFCTKKEDELNINTKGGAE
ncbi:MAG: DUF485 domain-containing protein [Spirochaetales bacterium]|nr:DUF485 domain-containing protein [Spirochaetales bacterium]